MPGAQFGTVAPDAAAQIIAKALAPQLRTLTAVQKPGSILERWPVKTGQDPGAAGITLDAVDTTVSQLGAFARPPQWTSLDTDPPVALQTARVAPAETTVWRVKAKIIALRLESDSDYHLELQDDSGAMMIAEIPLPDPAYIGNDNPFADLIRAARAAADAQFKPAIAALSFVPSPVSTKLVPASSVGPSSGNMMAAVAPKTLDLTAMSQSPETMQTFATSITPVEATLTGIAFFDKYHGQAGNAPNIIELHPVLDLQF